jgi:VIT1/CCC1 family predicted Fe2+/Mn2+ transporter
VSTKEAFKKALADIPMKVLVFGAMFLIAGFFFGMDSLTSLMLGVLTALFLVFEEFFRNRSEGKKKRTARNNTER